MKAVNYVIKKSILFLSLVFLFLMGCSNPSSGSSNNSDPAIVNLNNAYEYNGSYNQYGGELVLSVGDSNSIHIDIRNANNAIEHIPASNEHLSFSCSDESVVQIKNSTGSETFNIKCLKPGTAVFTIRYYEDEKQFTVKVLEKVQLSINKTSIEKLVGQTETLTVTVTPDTCSDKTVTWSSNNTSVATVDSNGTVTAVAPGTAKITVVSNLNNTVKKECNVTVRSSSEVVLNISQGGASVNKTKNLCTAYPGYVGSLVASLADSSETTFTWTSSNPDAVSVDSNGNVTYIGGGDRRDAAKATITCTAANGKSKTVECWSSFYPDFCIGGIWAEFGKTYELKDFGNDYRIFVYYFNPYYTSYTNGFYGDNIKQTPSNSSYVTFKSSKEDVIQFSASSGNELMELKPVGVGTAAISITVGTVTRTFTVVVDSSIVR